MIKKSVSAVDTFDLCQRKYGAGRKELGGAKKQNRFAVAGGDVHDEAEKYLRDGIPMTSPTGIALLPMLPAPKSCYSVEEWFEFELGGHTFVGKKDYTRFADGVWTIGDHKSTSDLKWAKTSEELLKDTQTLVYSAETMIRFDVDRVDNEWNYVQRVKPHKVRQVRLAMHEEHVAKHLPRIIATADRIENAHQKVQHWKELPYNASACNAIGGCPYRDECNLTSIERIQAMTEQKMSLRERLAAQKAKQQADGSVVESTPSGDTVYKPSFVAPPIQEPPPVMPVPQAVQEASYETSRDDAEKVAARRGRPPGSKNKPKTEDSTKVEDSTKEIIPVVAPGSIEYEPPTVRAGYTLYVNCLPVKGIEDAIDALTLTRPWHIEFLELQEGAPIHYMSIPYDGRARWCEFVECKLIGQTGHITLSTSTFEGADLEGVLTRNAVVVIRGGR